MLLFRSEVLNISLNELKRIGFLGSDIDILVCCIWLTKENVGLDIRVKEDRLLHDISALLAQSVHIISFHIFSINQNFTRVDVVESEKQVRQSAFAAARVTNKGYLSTSRDRKIKLIHDEVCPCRVIEVDIDKLYFTLFDDLNLISLGFADV